MDAVAAEELAVGAAVHRCKVCGKGFHRGRSLGGHMRSHISLGEVAPADQADADDEAKRVSSNGAGRSSASGAVGYGLRENPKKTRRLSDFAEDEEGGGGGGDHRACRECGKLFSSWKSLLCHMRSHASGPRDDEDVDLEDPFFPHEADEETVPVPDQQAVLAVPPKRRRRSMRVAAPVPAPQRVLSGFEKEQDVALCLLMLSRDTTLLSSRKMYAPLGKEERKKTMENHLHPSRAGYAYNSDDDSALFQYGDAKIKRKKQSTSNYILNYTPKQQCEVALPAKRTRYECPGCGRVFSSYQALGGHRASHKRINASCSAPEPPARPPAPERSVESYTSFSALSPSASPPSVATGIGAGKKTAAAVDKFECLVCFRVFASGKALGGHKRSHVMADASTCSDDGELYGSPSGNCEQEQGHSVVSAGSLDLNFPPAPSVDA